MPRIVIKTGKREPNQKVKNNEEGNGQRADAIQSFEKCLQKMPEPEIIELQQCHCRVIDCHAGKYLAVGTLLNLLLI